jgi:putative SOS response-associated peptidase YedK
MCCRYYYEDFERELRELMKAEAVVQLPDFDRSKTINRDISPSQASVTIHSAESNGGHKTDILGVSEMFWGFENPYRKGLIINARSETAREKNLFAESIVRRRCVIPASGFYEWDRFKARYRFTLPDNQLILLAGFYREEHGANRYTILTTEANDSMIKVHDRMPVMISRDEIRPWIYDDTKLPEFLGRKQPELICEQDSGQIRMDFGL